MKRGSIYVRLSAQADEANLSRDGMINECRALALREGIYVVAVHVDDGISGAVRDRPEFLAWLNDAREDRAEVLIANDGSRLTREGVNAAALVLDVIEGKDATTGAVVRPPVRFVSVDGLDSEKDAEAFRWRFVIAAEVARGERENIKRRNKASKARLREAGRHLGGAAPYGTRVVQSGAGDKRLARDETEAANLEHVARMLVANKPMMSALRWLNQQGVTTRRGNPWTSRSLKTTLSSAAMRDVVLKDDPATWLALQRRLSPGPDARRRVGAGRPPVWLLSRGNGICGLCGARLVIGSTRGKTRYMCNGRMTGMCGGLSIAAEPVDAFIEESYLAVHDDLPVVEMVTQWPGQEELRAAVQARDEAHAALVRAAQLGGDVLTANAAHEAAKQAVQHWEEVVKDSKPHVTLSVEGGSQGDRWRAASREDRWHIISEALARPIVVRPAGHGGVRRADFIDTSRVQVEWYVEAEPATNQ